MRRRPSSLVLRRQAINGLALGLASFATLLGLIALTWILATIIVNGATALGPQLFTRDTPPPGSMGGLRNALVGSAIMTGLGVLLGTPIGVLAGTHLAEFGRASRFAETIRFINDILLSAPSIVTGLFVYQIVVQPSGHFSGLAGVLALALVLLPVVVRSTDETLRLVPISLREAALALGAPHWRMVLRVLYPAARTGMLTGVLLGIARISGETAPLLFTALNNQYFSFDPAQPMANMPVVIFQFALSPYAAWHALAWAGALLMTLFVLLLSVAARRLLRTGSA
uniref:Phosphate transport system permease protein PstA n=1 Tax=Acidicaldus sp. TaxID=1872105 RepID=A0A8J4M6Y9_9PROT